MAQSLRARARASKLLLMIQEYTLGYVTANVLRLGFLSIA